MYTYFSFFFQIGKTYFTFLADTSRSRWKKISSTILQNKFTNLPWFYAYSCHLSVIIYFAARPMVNQLFVTLNSPYNVLHDHDNLPLRSCSRSHAELIEWSIKLGKMQNVTVNVY